MNGKNAGDCLKILTDIGANPDGWLPRESPEDHMARLEEKRKKQEEKTATADDDEDKEL